MSDAQVRLATALLILLLAVAALARFWTPTEEGDAGTVPVWSVVADDIVRLDIARADGTSLLLEKDAGKWNMESPFSGPVEPYLIETVLHHLESLKKGQSVSDAPPENFGLGEPPKIRVRATLVDGSTRELRIGDTAPVGDRLYVLGEGARVLAADSTIQEPLSAPADEWRDHRIFAFEPSKVAAVQIVSAEGTLRVRRDGDVWWLEGFTRADVDKVDDLLLGLLDLRFERFDPAQPPIVSPRYAVELALADGSFVRAAVAAPTADEAAAMVDPVAQVQVEGGSKGTIGAAALALLGQGPTDVGDRQAFPLNADTAQSIAITLGDRKTLLEKVGDTWQAKSGAKADSVLAAVRGAQIAYRREPVPPLAAPWGTVEIRDGTGISSIDIGQPEGAEFRVAQDRAGGAPYLVRVSDLDAIIAALAAP